MNARVMTRQQHVGSVFTLIQSHYSFFLSLQSLLDPSLAYSENYHSGIYLPAFFRIQNIKDQIQFDNINSYLYAVFLLTEE